MRQDIDFNVTYQASPPASDADAPMSDGRRRRGYLDWMRGLAVLVMIEAHVLDSWTRLDARHSWRSAGR